MDKTKFRKKFREQWEKEWINEAVRARKFSGEETFEQGLRLIRFALEFKGAAKDAGYE